MIIKTKEQTTLSKIKINEVFALQGCWAVAIRLSKRAFMLLAVDEPTDDNTLGVIFYTRARILRGWGFKIFKLSRADQELFYKRG
jgi:hypothetical protein